MLTLQDLQGHETIKRSLHNALAQNRVAHAYLFSGPPGVGKKTAAFALARDLLCRAGADWGCGHCASCRIFAQGSHPDFHVIEPQGNYIKIEQLKSLARETAYSPYGGGRQIYLVRQAEKMTREAANCILKVLEEPPPGVVFILLADEAGALLPTIVSRCQCYRFHLLPERDVRRVLAARLPEDNDGAAVAARVAQGSPGQALAFLAGGDQRDQAWELLQRLLQKQPHEPLPPPVELEQREAAAEFIHSALLFFRDALVWQLTGREALLINLDYRDQIQWLADRYSKQEMLAILITLHQSARRVAGNVNLRLALDSLMLKMAGIGYA